MNKKFFDVEQLKEMALYEESLNQSKSLSLEAEKLKVKKIGLMAAMDVEADFLLNSLQKIYGSFEKEAYLGRLFYRFVDFKKDFSIILVVCGIGTVNAAITANLLFEREKVDFLLHTGIAGALGKNLRTLDFVIPNKIAYYRQAGLGYNISYPYKKEVSKLESYLLPQVWQEHAKKIFTKLKLERSDLFSTSNLREGLILTSDLFVDKDAQKKEMLFHYEDATACEMEGASIAKLAYIYRKPYLIVRCISDTADEQANLDYATFEKRASDLSANFVLSFITTTFFI